MTERSERSQGDDGPVTFGSRLQETFEASGHLCVGIDPHPYLLQRWGLDDTPAAVEEFGNWVIDAVAGRAGIIKPQVAFYERHGAAGFAALERVLASARAVGLVTIADAKRGDIGSSVDAYGEAWLRPGSPLEADAVTLSPYLGVGALDGPLQRALDVGKGAFVLAATSNPDARGVQTARVRDGGSLGGTVVSAIVSEVQQSNRRAPGPASLGVVIGATADLAAVGLDTDAIAGLPVLAPGFGTQGARFEDLRTIYGAATATLVVAVSRSILEAGPGDLADAVSTAAKEVEACLR